MKTRKDVLLTIDMDDTIVDLMPRWLALYDAALNTENGPDVCDIKEWELEQYFKHPDVLWSLLPEALRSARPKSEVLDVIKQYADQVTLVTTVAAKCDMQEILRAKLHWLATYFGESKGFHTTQSAYQRSAKFPFHDVLVDDNPANIEAWLASRPDRTAVLIDMPWNKKTLKQVNRYMRFPDLMCNTFETVLNAMMDKHFELANASQYLGEHEQLDAQRAWDSKGFPTDSAQRKEYPVATGLLAYFPLACLEVSNVSFEGNKKHAPGKPLQWVRQASTDQLDAASRHLIEYLSGKRIDEEGGNLLAKTCWRLLAQLQLDLEKERGVK